jgi:RHS repeat-associated protein
VFFDDFTIIHEKNTYSLRVVESIDYDPFGVVLEGTHYVDISRPLNSYLYQGEFAEFEKLTGWYRFALRGNYDGTLGRWFSSDPYSQFSSDYVGMGNDFINGSDTDGGLFFSLGGAVAGAFIGGALGGVAGYFFDRDNWQKWAMVGALAVGLYTGFTMDPLTFSPGNVSGLAKFRAQFEQVFTGNSGYVMEGYRRIWYHTYGMERNIELISWLDEIVIEGRKLSPTIGLRQPKPLFESIPVKVNIKPLDLPNKPHLRPLVANMNQFGVFDTGGKGSNTIFSDVYSHFDRKTKEELIEWLKENYNNVQEIVIEVDSGITGSAGEVETAIQKIRDTIRTWRVPSGKIKIRRLKGTSRGGFIRIIPFGK